MALIVAKQSDYNGPHNIKPENRYLVAINETVPDISSFIHGIQTYLQVENTLQSQHFSECITHSKTIDVLGPGKEIAIVNLRIANKKIYDAKLNLEKVEENEQRLREILKLVEQFLVQDMHNKAAEKK